ERGKVKIAVLFNSSAGKHDVFHQYAERIANAFHGHAFITCSGGMGEDYLAPHIPQIQSIPCKEEQFIEKINEAAQHMVNAEPDLLICVGGDGFIAYTADWLIRNRVSIPLMG